MFRNYISRRYVRICILIQICQNLTSCTYRFTTQGFGSAPKIGLIKHQNLSEHYLCRAPVEQSVGQSRQDVYQYHHTHDPPDVSNTFQRVSLFSNFVEIHVVLFIVNKNGVEYYHVGMRRKCKTMTGVSYRRGRLLFCY